MILKQTVARERVRPQALAHRQPLPPSNMSLIELYPDWC